MKTLKVYRYFRWHPYLCLPAHVPISPMMDRHYSDCIFVVSCQNSCLTNFPLRPPDTIRVRSNPDPSFPVSPNGKRRYRLLFLHLLSICAGFLQFAVLRLCHHNILRLPSPCAQLTLQLFDVKNILSVHLLCHPYSVYHCILKRYEFKCRGGWVYKRLRRVLG